MLSQASAMCTRYTWEPRTKVDSSMTTVYVHLLSRIIESFRLEETVKIIESNH